MYVKTDGRKVSYVFKGVEGSYESPYIDEASIENSITCAAVALYLGLTPEELAERMAQLEPIAMRLEVKEGQRGLILINDSYNSDINSLDIALDFMNRRIEKTAQPSSLNPQPSALKKTLILSDIYQTGESSAELYREVSDLVSKRASTALSALVPSSPARPHRLPFHRSGSSAM